MLVGSRTEGQRRLPRTRSAGWFVGQGNWSAARIAAAVVPHASRVRLSGRSHSCSFAKGSCPSASSSFSFPLYSICLSPFRRRSLFPLWHALAPPLDFAVAPIWKICLAGTQIPMPQFSPRDNGSPAELVLCGVRFLRPGRVLEMEW